MKINCHDTFSKYQITTFFKAHFQTVFAIVLFVILIATISGEIQQTEFDFPDRLKPKYPHGTTVRVFLLDAFLPI
ncbi:hypothetical protein FK004_04330 [Flavobacterium kingsejongi]|uniref:Uncharacterized protein n=1 Tax=Flavobacterium kingsejongi TaxID=1678728 RepID=A0A2S1LL83_9FLAO|nr:hypothetical protein FK004_04330 [Flavobacterium kingsejongi]